MIFMKLRSRSSRATGPKMRVPLGLLAWASRTAAFSSKRMSEPSGRRYSLLTRTTTAFTTSPFLTWPPGCADLTVAVMMSPTDAYLRYCPPATRMQRISLAPELSATLSRVSCWITCLLRLLHDLEHAPANLLRDGLRFGDADEVAHAAFVPLVVNLELRAPLHRLAVEAVRLRG